MANSPIFLETFRKSLKYAERHQRLLSLLQIEISPLESTTIEDIQKTLQGLLREHDTLEKIEEQGFTLLLTDFEHPKVIGVIAEKILSALPGQTKGHIGISLYPEDGQTLEALQTKANEAMRLARNLGENNYTFMNPRHSLEAREYVQLQEALHRAIQEQEFVLYYQPKLDLKTREITGVEALLRWKHPSLGLLDPLMFISSAEETGIITKIGAWALQQACLTNKAWQEQGFQAISIAVNLSPKQLFTPGLRETVEEVLKESRLDPKYLELEITEMTIMDDIDKVKPILQGLKDLGISLSLDDFGTGYTSLSYLKNYPISIIKIDQSFIKSLPQEDKSAAITRAMISLGHQLDCTVVAEGVETSEQLEFLAGEGCDLAQGYYVSRPLPAEKMIAKLKKSS